MKERKVLLTAELMNNGKEMRKKLVGDYLLDIW